MKIRPKNYSQDVHYPSLREYAVTKNSELLRVMTAVGISFGAVLTPVLMADGAIKNEAVSDSTDKIKIEIAKLCQNLGDQDFKAREQATITLIALGNRKIKDEKGQEICNQVVKDAVVAAMNKMKKDKDPEVKQRAKRIILALNPPKNDKIRNNIPRLGGVMIAPQHDD